MTEWSESGKHTGRTDVPLTPAGESQAADLAPRLAGFDPGLVLSSPLQRAHRTGTLAGFQPEDEGDLVEWDYGGYEGLTTPQIRAGLGYDWAVFEHGVVPGETPGETVEEVAARASRVLRRVGPVLTEMDVLLFGHGHALRALAAVFLREEPRLGAKLLLDAGSVSVLEYAREQPAVAMWNATD